MSDESEIVRLETLLEKAVDQSRDGCIDAYRRGVKYRYYDCHGAEYRWYGSKTGYLAATIAIEDGDVVRSEGPTKLEALRNLRDKLRAELVRRRDEHNAAIAMLGSE